MSSPVKDLMTIVPVQEVLPATRSMICRAALIGLLAFITTACASFPENRLPKVDGITTQAQVSTKPSAYLALRFMVDFSGRRAVWRRDHRPVADATTSRGEGRHGVGALPQLHI